jgi:hypothetical protein
MKTYNCDKELELILLNNGFAETTSELDQNKGKKKFRFKRTKKSVRFDYKKFLFFEGISQSEGFGTSKVKEGDLKLLFWYLQANSNDREEICSGEKFSAKTALENFISFKKELDFYLSNGYKNRSISKLTRLVSAFEKIKIN